VTIAEEQIQGAGRIQPLRYLLRASALYGVAGAIGKAGALITVPIVTRALGPAEYGLLDLSTALIGLATLVGGLSAELPAARLAAEHPDKRAATLTTYAATVIAITTVIAIALLVAQSFIASVVWSDPTARPLVITASGAVILTSIQLATWNIHRLQDRPVAYAVLSMIDIGLKVILIVAVAIAGSQAGGIVAVYLVVAGIGAVAGLWSVRRDLTGQILPWAIRPMLVGGAMFTVIGVAFVAAGYAVRSLLSGEVGGAAVGQMGVAIRLASVLALPLAAFQFAWAPPSMAADQSPASRTMFKQSTLGVLIAGGLAALVVACFSPEAVLVLAGNEFTPAAEAVAGLAASTVLAAAFFMLGVAISAARAGLHYAALAAVGGALLQFLVTALAIAPLGDQAAVGTGSVLGYAAAVLITLAYGKSRLLDTPWVIVAASLVITAAAIAVQTAIVLDMTVIRWIVGAASAIAFAVTVGRNLAAASPSADEG
jgi:O-antigen/teichoic acid export membrane protein